MPTERTPKVAIIHDWLVSDRGGEKVLEAILEIYPQAEIFTLFHKPGSVGRLIEKHRIHTSFLNHLPAVEKYYRYLLPLFPLAIERFDLKGFDLVISSSHCVAKGVIVSPQARHICYCHTPMRYAWDRYQDYFGNSLAEPFLYPFIHYLRLWDATSSNRVDSFIANSHYIAARIEKAYRRSSEVVYPFVDLERFPVESSPPEDYFLTVAAFAPYKRIDLAIRACEKLGKRLIVVGSGQNSQQLKSLAGRQTEFVGRVETEGLLELYRGCRALLFPGEEDFGISPLEAMACGKPVIAFGRGGVTETVIEGKTGLFFYEQSVESLCDAMERFDKMTLLPEDCRAQAERFSRTAFLNAFLKTIQAAATTAASGAYWLNKL